MCWFSLFLFIYLALGLAAFYLAHRLPRNPVVDPPDWGTVEDVTLPCSGGGFLEAWRVVPEGESLGTAVFCHGWGRNRDKMTSRARTLGRMGFTVILPSVRDHGHSSSFRWMNAVEFGKDIQTVVEWANEPVILYGHSAGAGGAIVFAAHYPEKIRLLILEGCYTHTRRALLRLYYGFHPLLGIFLGPMILLIMEIFYTKGPAKLSPEDVSPIRLAPKIDAPVLLVHGDRDEKFPVHWVWEMEKAFPAGRAEVCIITNATHTETGETSHAARALRAFVARHLKL